VQGTGLLYFAGGDGLGKKYAFQFAWRLGRGVEGLNLVQEKTKEGLAGSHVGATYRQEFKTVNG